VIFIIKNAPSSLKEGVGIMFMRMLGIMAAINLFYSRNKPRKIKCAGAPI
jgi:hypothetical protein